MGSCLATYNKTQKPSVFACSVNAPKVCPQIFGPGDEILPPKTLYELFHNLRNYYVHTCSNIDLPFQHNKWRSSSKTYQPLQKAKIQSCRKCKRREMNPILFKKHSHHHNKWRKNSEKRDFFSSDQYPVNTMDTADSRLAHDLRWAGVGGPWLLNMFVAFGDTGVGFNTLVADRCRPWTSA